MVVKRTLSFLFVLLFVGGCVGNSLPVVRIYQIHQNLKTPREQFTDENQCMTEAKEKLGYPANKDSGRYLRLLRECLYPRGYDFETPFALEDPLNEQENLTDFSTIRVFD